MKRAPFYLFLALGGVVLTLSAGAIVFVWILNAFGLWEAYEKGEGDDIVATIFVLSMLAMLVGLPFVLLFLIYWLDWVFRKAMVYDEMSW